MPRPRRGRGGAARAGKAAVARPPSAEPVSSPNDGLEQQSKPRGRPRGRPRKTPSVARLSINDENAIQAANHTSDESLTKLANGDTTTASEGTALRASSRSSIELGRFTAATPGHNRRDTSGLDLGDSVFGNLDDSFADGDIPGSARSGDLSTMSYSALRTQSRRSSFIGRNDPPIRPSSRSGNTPRIGSSFNIGLFKRRAREPSIIGTNREPLQEPSTVDQDSEGDNEEDFEPEAESTPLNNRRRTRQSNDFAEPESPEAAESSNPRKRKSLDAQQSSTRPEKVSRTEPGPSRQSGERDSLELSDAPPSPEQNQAGETSESELSDVSSPRGPPSRLPPRPVTPVNQEEIAAPPASSGSEGPDAWPDIRSLAKKRRRPSVTTPTRLDNLSDMSSPPSLTHSPNYDTAKPSKTRGRPPQRQQASPKITTADLTSLLPKRRYKKPRDPLGLESDEELDTSGLGHEDDELSYLDTQTARRRKRGRPPSRAAASRSTSRGGRAGGSSLQSKRTAESIRSASRAVRSRSHHSSDKENADDNGRDSDDNMSENNEEGEGESRFVPLADNTFDGAAGETTESVPTEELKQASNKFKEVDRWELEFEEVTEASSPQDGR
ncbi:atp-dependent rna helicase mrh4 [Trichoderma arundinaceum]|uniref:Atp-dependent rna helicase mrh4 n=1 Tax=Trichoderma arundinaceum TaxID=490622 RepID=A0A395P0A8_TRIAR|nr:atp-dependent rna helicase mrh4 [Trichoderma arundinaceum]